LAAGLATAWNLGQSADAQQPTIPVDLSVTPNQELNNTYFTIYFPGSSSPGVAVATPLTGVFFPADQTTNIEFNANLPVGYSDNPLDNLGDLYGLVGRYTGGGVSIAFNQTDAAIDLGLPYSTVFLSPTESSLETSLVTDDIGTVQSLYVNNGFPITVPFATGMELLDFSNAINGGTISANVAVPEPGAVAMIGAAALGLLRRRRRPAAPA